MRVVAEAQNERRANPYYRDSYLRGCGFFACRRQANRESKDGLSDYRPATGAPNLFRTTLLACSTHSALLSNFAE
jgi:hypothetical protein